MEQKPPTFPPSFLPHPLAFRFWPLYSARMSDDELYIDYPTMIDEAMRTVVQKSLIQVREAGALPGDHHFFISFDTNFPACVFRWC